MQYLLYMYESYLLHWKYADYKIDLQQYNAQYPGG